MTQLSLPWEGVSPGDAGAYSSAQWAQGWRYLMGLAAHRPNVGVMLGSGDGGVEGLHVQATNPASANIEVTTGSALVNGRLFINDATETLTVGANSSGNPRIDTVILRADFTAQTVRLILKAGTPAISPTPPALTQVANVLWEIPLADVAVADSFLTIADTDITPRAEYANAADGVYLDMVLNNSGVELNTGDVVIWDTTADRAVTTTTTANSTLVAGVWQGRTANGGYGRLLVRGIGLVRVNGAVAARNQVLTTSTTAKQAQAVEGRNRIGVSLEITGGAGLCLAAVNVATGSGEDYILIQDQKAQNTAGGTFTNGAWQTRTLNTIVSDAGGHAALAANQITLQPGTYRVFAHAPAYIVSGHQTRLRNITDGTTIATGTSERSAAGDAVQSRSMLHGRFTIASAKVIELQHQCATTRATDGFGFPNNFTTEVYATAEFTKEI